MTDFTKNVLILNEKDNVAVALKDIPQSSTFNLQNNSIQVQSDIRAGFKISMTQIPQGQNVIKYGHIIGRAIVDIAPGEEVHIKNMKSVVK